MNRESVEIDLSDDEPATRVYTCRVCGTTGPWGPGWAWYGSWRDLDNDPSNVVVCCSAACRRQHAEDNAVPAELVD